MSDQTNDVLKSISDTLTEEPVSIAMDILPRNRWHRWAQENKYLSRYFQKKKEYLIKPITYANLERISKLLVDVNIDLDSNATVNEIALPILAQKGDLVPKIIAIAVTNGRSMPPKSLVQEIKYCLTAQESFMVVLIVLKQMDVRSFLNTIIYSKGMMQREREKKNDEKSAATLQK